MGKRQPRKCHRHSTRGLRPWPKSRCSVRPSNVPAASCQRRAITSGARSRAGSSPISSAPQMAGCCHRGLWDQWKEPETGETISSATLVVTAANDFTRSIHDRMPVLLGQQDHEAWLTGKAGVELLRLAPNDLLRMWPVSKRVNASGRGDDDPSLIEPVEDAASRQNPQAAPYVAREASPCKAQQLRANEENERNLSLRTCP